jgi:hypothetical protein
MVLVERFALIVPATEPKIRVAAAEHDKIECYQGTKATNNFGITVEGAGAWAKGHIKGTLDAYDYKALYQVYSLKDSESANYWFINYSKTTNHDNLKKVFEDSKTVRTNYDLEFELQGNDYGITAVYITYQVIRLVLNGQTKDYVVTNPASSGANLPDGSTYPGGFKPVGAPQPASLKAGGR